MPSSPTDFDSPSTLIDFRNVTVFRGDAKALDSISITITLGEQVAIIGPNGSGKSTFIKTIVRECHPVVAHDSHVKILGSERWNIFKLRPQLGIVSPDWAELCTRPISGKEAVLSGFFSSAEIWPHNKVTPRMEEKAAEVMKLLEIDHLAAHDMSEMSTGEVRRIVIGRALVHDPKALILDEPTASLDLRASYELREILRKIAQAGTGIVLVTHHIPDIIPEISRIILMREGRIFEDGPKTEVLSSSHLSRLFGLELDLLQRDGYYGLF